MCEGRGLGARTVRRIKVGHWGYEFGSLLPTPSGVCSSLHAYHCKKLKQKQKKQPQGNTK